MRNSTEHSVFNYDVLLLILSLLLNEKNATVKVGAFSKRQSVLLISYKVFFLKIIPIKSEYIILTG